MNHPALIVLDFINDIVHAEGKFASGTSFAQEIAQANQAIAHCRAKNWPVIFVKVGFNEGYHECPAHSPIFGGAKKSGALALAGWGTEFHTDLDFRPEDIVVIKHRISPFYATSLEALLRVKSIDTVVLCGVSTAWAVEASARDAHDRDYHVVVLSDACSAHDRELHNNALTVLRSIAQVVDTATWLKDSTN